MNSLFIKVCIIITSLGVCGYQLEFQNVGLVSQIVEAATQTVQTPLRIIDILLGSPIVGVGVIPRECAIPSGGAMTGGFLFELFPPFL